MAVEALLLTKAKEFGQELARMVTIHIDLQKPLETVDQLAVVAANSLQAVLAYYRREGIPEDLVRLYAEAANAAMMAEWRRMEIATAGEGSSARH